VGLQPCASTPCQLGLGPAVTQLRPATLCDGEATLLAYHLADVQGAHGQPQNVLHCPRNVTGLGVPAGFHCYRSDQWAPVGADGDGVSAAGLTGALLTSTMNSLLLGAPVQLGSRVSVQLRNGQVAAGSALPRPLGLRQQLLLPRRLQV